MNIKETTPMTNGEAILYHPEKKTVDLEWRPSKKQL
jgi:hypothetical protein